MINSNTCFTESIVLGIAENRVSEAELSEYERHLETCESCQEYLESHSAEADLWQSVRDFLPDSQDDQQRFDCVGHENRDISQDVAELLKFMKPTEDPHMLGRLGPYEVSGIIGAGGMGIVVKAFEPSLARFVALKVLAPRLWSDAAARERFAREARAAASIVHENVIEIFGVHQVDEIPFFAMPYLRGETLEDRIERQGPLRVEEVLRVAAQVAAGLAAAHAQALVHRDVKPGNILLCPGADRVRITDFGIAHLDADPRLTQSGSVTGTPQYMSPEQVRSETLDGRSDLFSLGSVMYAMCAGRPPFEADSNYQLMQQVVSAEAVPVEVINPAVPDWLAAVIAKLHSPAPSDRYPSAEELDQDLRQCLASLQQPTTLTRPRSVSRLEASYRRKHRFSFRRLFLGGLCMVICMITIVALMFLQPADATAADSVDVRGRVVNDAGEPVPGVTVVVVRKTWPNNRFRQEMLKTTTDKKGQFAIKEFAKKGKQYAFLLTVISNKHLMTSEYRLVRDGTQQDPIVLRTATSQPVTIQFKDSEGKPVANVRALPGDRMTKDGTAYLSYARQVHHSGVAVDQSGKVQFGSWKPGEKAELDYLVGDQYGSAKFSIPEDRSVVVEVSPSKPAPVSGRPIHVAGQVVRPDGKPLSKAQVLAIQKTWPNNRYRQNALSTRTDAQGTFRFDKFATEGGQYAFLLTVVADGYTMVSDYQVVRDGSQKPPITLKVESAKPVTFVVTANGQPVKGVEISPSRRNIDEQTMYLLYAAHMKDTAKTTNGQGEVSSTLWRPGESGSVYFSRENQRGELEFMVNEDRRVVLTLP